MIRLGRIGLRAERVRWDDPGLLLREAPWELVLGADLLYERRNADQLLELLPRLGADVLLADFHDIVRKGQILARRAVHGPVCVRHGIPARPLARP